MSSKGAVEGSRGDVEGSRGDVEGSRGAVYCPVLVKGSNTQNQKIAENRLF